MQLDALREVVGAAAQLVCQLSVIESAEVDILEAEDAGAQFVAPPSASAAAGPLIRKKMQREGLLPSKPLKPRTPGRGGPGGPRPAGAPAAGAPFGGNGGMGQR